MDSSVAAEDIVPRPPAGRETGDLATSGPSSHDDPKNRDNVGGFGLWSGLSEVSPKTKTTGMLIQTKERRSYHGARWTAVKGVQSSRRTLRIVC